MSELAALMRPAPAPLARTPRRGAHSRGTCRSWRTRARAARCRPAARRAAAAATAAGSVVAARDRAHPVERLLERGGVAADEHHAAHLAAEGLRERREVLVLALAAGDQDQGTRACRPPRRASRRRWCPWSHRRRSTPAHLGDPLRAVRQGPRSCCSSVEHRRLRQRERLAERERGERVGGVVRAADLHRRARGSSGSPRARQPPFALAAARRRSPRRCSARSEKHRVRAAGVRHGHHQRIVEVDHRGVAAREDARLGGRVARRASA